VGAEEVAEKAAAKREKREEAAAEDEVSAPVQDMIAEMIRSALKNFQSPDGDGSANELVMDIILASLGRRAKAKPVIASVKTANAAVRGNSQIVHALFSGESTVLDEAHSSQLPLRHAMGYDRGGVLHNTRGDAAGWHVLSPC
jgi:hypothetical protein